MVFFSKLVRIVKSTNIVWHLTDPLQFLHPLEAEGYRETVRAIRTIGRDCIQKRIRTLVIESYLKGDSRKNENYLARFIKFFQTQVRL